MKKLRDVSVISTVLNEEKSITKFLDSLINQTVSPREIIFVDGGSKDGTLKILKDYAKRNNILKVFQEVGANISEGRNFAIKKARGNIIATCDAGGKYKQNWLENLTEGFNGSVGFGIDKPLIGNGFQKALAKVIVHQDVCGSSRNIIPILSQG